MTRTLQMDHVVFEIFSDLDYRDDEGTLVAYAPDTDFADLRCSVTSIFRKGVEVLEVAEQEIPERAVKAGTKNAQICWFSLFGESNMPNQATTPMPVTRMALR